MSTELETLLAPIFQGIQDLQTTKYVWVSALAILVFDCIIKFEDERRWIWSRKLSGLQVLVILLIVNVICFNLPQRFLTDKLYVARPASNRADLTDWQLYARRL
ncbi:hypothetical protein EXIGLDRAFT_761166 [Exidia glandulosa HHB12029]|uniref:DUF6533 domain-containing protein n=1 Tax=Exidia glandulosa HHB12029 TaxID=1314781 RepID=A0A165NSH0_EXIGL|nr:hypothetical protein EXIGLDRAFT_761166 [Exidia glandulosa HHB12029]